LLIFQELITLINILHLLILIVINYSQYRRIISVYMFIFPDSLHFYTILSRKKKYRKTLSRQFDQRGISFTSFYFFIVFGPQITLQCIHTVFQLCAMYTRRDHLCFSCESRKLNNFLLPSIFTCR